jgi:GNAT superfamily N-acetyltransferase
MHAGLSFMGTDPPYQKRGAATMMVQWGIGNCRREGVPAYLESTMEAASLYKKNGFKAAADISLEIGRKPGDGSVDVYREVACLFQPLPNSLQNNSPYKEGMEI